MIIKNVELIKMSCFFEKEWKWSGGYFPGWHAILVRIQTESDVEGFGEIGAGVLVPDIVEVVLNTFKRLLVGRGVEDVQDIVDSLYRNSFVWGRRGVVISVIGGIDIALHDILGKALGVPVYILLGGKKRSKIKVYASGGVIGGEDLDALQDELNNYVKQGFKAVKIRIGYGIKKDTEIVKAAREAVGDEVDLMLDAGQNYVKQPWDLLTAMEIAKKLEKFNPFFIEEPLPSDNLNDLRKLCKSTIIPIAGGESGSWRYEFIEIIEKEAMDIIQPDCVLAGGLRETKRICEYAENNGVIAIPHTWGSAPGLMANLHLNASTNNCLMSESSQMENPFRTELLEKDPDFIDGYVTVPDTVGLGVKISEEYIRKHPFDINALPPGSMNN